MICYPNVKVNLGLNIVAKRPDGFHDIETVFVPFFAVRDRLEIIAADDFSSISADIFSKYRCDGQISQGMSEDGKLMITVAYSKGVDWNPLSDLCAKAYYLLDKEFNLPSVKIFLEKLSPVGAGLGGGSSDAAFTLKMLSELFDLGLNEGQLADYASRLGSDCAFFIYNRPMLGLGRGEVLSEVVLEDLDYGQEGAEACNYVLSVVTPENVAVSTALAYRGVVPSVPETRVQAVLTVPFEEWNGLLINDFEKNIFHAYPVLGEIKTLLYEKGAVYASMSGSGSSIFSINKRA